VEKYSYRFSFGPWNIHEGADPFGPPVRPSRSLDEKLPLVRQLGFDAIQLHDDDAIPNLDDLSSQQLVQAARDLRRQIEDAGLTTEWIAPRLWEDARTIDGAFTANDPAVRAYASDRARKSIDIAREMDTDLILLWLAREGTYIRESKDGAWATERLIEAVNELLAYDPGIRILIEPKPNEPMDLAYIPTIGHGVALGMFTSDPARVGVLMESAHAVLAGLDPSDEMAFALGLRKLWGVHLNDQNGLKFDQDRSFGSVDLRRAFNQVRVLDEHEYWNVGMVGFDVKTMRTQKAERATAHLRNSLDVFLRLVGVVRSMDRQAVSAAIDGRDYEELDHLVMNALLGG